MQEQKQKELNQSDLKFNKYEKGILESYPYQSLSIKIAIISIFAALAIGMSYALAPLINIEFMSFTLFLAGFLYGKYVGIFVGLISSTIYYGWNPFGIPPLPLYMVLVSCMVFIGLIGGLIKSSDRENNKINVTKSTLCKFAFIGLFYTLSFEVITNIVFAYFYYNGDIKLAFLTGLPFMIIHLILNTIIFALLVIPVYNTVISIQ
ncbi:MAG: ECF transporter S component [Promethearchaeota archaeon]